MSLTKFGVMNERLGNVSLARSSTNAPRGSGKGVRSFALASADDLDHPDVRALIDAGLRAAKTPIPAGGAHALIIKSVSAKHRPRRAVSAKKR